MSAQSQLLSVASTLTGGIGAVGALSKSLDSANKDIKMADVARKTLSGKIEAINKNKGAASAARAKFTIGGNE